MKRPRRNFSTHVVLLCYFCGFKPSGIFPTPLPPTRLFPNGPLRPLIHGLGLLLLLSSSACRYQKLLNSDDPERKLEAARSYYQEGAYNKAQPLLENLLSYTRGTEDAEEVRYMYAVSEYELENYTVAAYYFKLVHEVFPFSTYAEEALYRHAYCLYRQSPPVALDQSPSYEAIDAFQLFANKYPESDRIDEVNNYIDLLRSKLRRKDTRQALLWHQIYDFRAAVWNLENLLQEYPQHPRQEYLEYMLIDARTEVALKSVASRKEERLLDASRQIRHFKKTYPQSEYRPDVLKLENRISDALKDIQLTSQQP